MFNDFTNLEKIPGIQQDHAAWVIHNFGMPDNENKWQPLVGIIEEIGEFAHAYLKKFQGIRGTAEDHDIAMRDAVGDIAIYLMDFCTRVNLDYKEILFTTWHSRVGKEPMYKHVMELSAKASALRLLLGKDIHYTVNRNYILEFVRCLWETANRLDLILTEVVVSTWEGIVKKRDWKQNNSNGI